MGIAIGYSLLYALRYVPVPSTPLPVTINPREVFERLFGDGDSLDAKSRLAQLRRQASILDFVAQDAKRLSHNMGANDKKKLDEYLHFGARHRKAHPEGGAGRQRGRRAARLCASVRRAGQLRGLFAHDDRPAGAGDAGRPDPGLHLHDRPRSVSGRSYPEIGVPDAHHPLSHHGNDPEKIAKLTKINTLHMEQVAYYLKRMSETKEGDGSLLDNTLVLAGASLADLQPARPSRLAGHRGRRPDQGQPPCGSGKGYAHDQHDAVDDGHFGRGSAQRWRLHRAACPVFAA